MPPSRVLYFSQWFPPENGAVGLQVAKGLIAKGHEVEVLTGFPNYPTGRLSPGYKLAPYRREVMDGVVVHRVFLYPSHDRSSFGRALNYLSFFISSLFFCLIKGHRYDVIYVYHPPILPGLAAALSGLLTGRPFVLEVQDLWPDSVAASAMSGTGVMTRALNPVCRYVYSRAAYVLGQSRGMAARLVERGARPERTAVMFNWADEASARATGGFDISTLGFEGRFNLVYAGNMGPLQALETLIEAAHQLAVSEPQIQLTLIGEGSERSRLQALVTSLGARNVQILPGVPQARIGDVLAAADALIVHLRDDPLFEITLPSKLQFYLAMGRPVLAGVRGEAASIVVDADVGRAFEPESVSSAAEAFARLARTPKADLEAMGRRARTVYEDRFSFAASLSTIDGALQSALGS